MVLLPAGLLPGHGERELRATLSDRTIPAERKATLVETIFGGKVAAATLALLRQAAACRTGSLKPRPST